uniref:Ribosomal protein L34Ae n=1 Tax=Chenopodium quinoa TaxID=63459 RepID=A0A803N3H2_CHEQI
FITQKKDSNIKLIQPQEEHQTNEKIEVESIIEEESEPVLRFRFPTFKEFLQNNDVNNNDAQSTSYSKLCENLDENHHVESKDDCVKSEIDTTVKASHEFLHVEEISKRGIGSECEVFGSEKNGIIFDEFLHVANVIEDNLNVMKIENGEELCGIWNDSMIKVNVAKNVNEVPSDAKSLVNNSTNDEDIMKNGSEIPSDAKSLVNGSMNIEDIMRNGCHLPSDDESIVSDLDLDSLAPSSESSFRSSFIDSFSDGFLSDIDFERAFEVDTSMEFDELKKLESNFEGDDNGDSNKEHEANMETEPEKKQDEEKQSSGEQLSSDSDEQNGLETQWEHQDLVEQLKMEIKKVRAIGLPTILEESESPKIMDDLKPWKIEGKYKLGGTLDELNKFYKSYKERMRKLDILNYQKMYAIGFLRLKDPLKSISKNRISTPALATIVSLDCWPCKPKLSTEINQPVMKKFSRELESDLEMVYVGQMCLSWEFLRWQYGKALDLWDTDPHGIHRYNEVADKFQTFQVLLTRFLEDERFQGPRVQNYVKNRCVQQNLLQVPLIRDDNARDRKKEKKFVSSKDAITSLQLVEVIEDSIRVLWRFIRSDKDTTYIGLLKCRRNSNAELQNPADASLLDQIQSSLQKVVSTF